MYKVVVRLKCLSTDTSMWATTLLSFKKLIRTLAFPNARIVGGGATQCFCVKFKGPNVSNVMVLTNQSITNNLLSITKPTNKQIHLN